jgi:ABC-type arginine/histidine transport system permease subunit
MSSIAIIGIIDTSVRNILPISSVQSFHLPRKQENALPALVCEMVIIIVIVKSSQLVNILMIMNIVNFMVERKGVQDRNIFNWDVFGKTC